MREHLIYKQILEFLKKKYGDRYVWVDSDDENIIFVDDEDSNTGYKIVLDITT